MITHRIRTLESTLRSIRIVYVVIFIAMIEEIRVVERVIPHVSRDVRTFWLGLLVLGVAEISLALFFRFRMLRPAELELQSSPDDPVALGRWWKAHFLSFVFSNTVVLLGFSLRMTGGAPMQSLPFYMAGISMMLLWWPRQP